MPICIIKHFSRYEQKAFRLPVLHMYTIQRDAIIMYRIIWVKNTSVLLGIVLQSVLTEKKIELNLTSLTFADTLSKVCGAGQCIQVSGHKVQLRLSLTQLSFERFLGENARYSLSWKQRFFRFCCNFITLSFPLIFHFCKIYFLL